MISRTVGEDLAVQELINELGPYAALMHHRLLAFQDRNGNVRADENSLKANCFPLDSKTKPHHCVKFLKALENKSLIKIYEHGGIRYANFPNFTKHQPGLNYNKEKDEHPLAPWQISGKQQEDFRKNSGKIPEKVCPQSEVEEEVKLIPPLTPPLIKPDPIPPETGGEVKNRSHDVRNLVTDLVSSKTAKPSKSPASEKSTEVNDAAIAICDIVKCPERDKGRIFQAARKVAVTHGVPVLWRIKGTLEESLRNANPPVKDPLKLALWTLNKSANAP